MTFRSLHTARKNPLAVETLGLKSEHLCTADLLPFPNLTLLYLEDCTFEISQGVQIPWLEDFVFTGRREQTFYDVIFLPAVFPNLLSLHLEYVKNAQEAAEIAAEFAVLEKLIICQGDLWTLPFGGKFPASLRHLDLGGNILTEIGDAIGTAVNLEVFRAEYNKITRISSKIGHLRKLRVLSLQGNQLTKIPRLTHTENLAEADFSRNQLTGLPASLLRGRFLFSLDISHNPVGAFPASVCDMPRLRTLRADGCKLKSLPRRFAQLQSLVTLSLQVNHFRFLPKSLCDLSKLEVLNLQNNYLQSLPSEIGHMSALRQLNLAGNQLSALPEKFAELKRLFELDLSRNEFTNLPPEVLLLGLNKLSGLPHYIFLRSFLSAFKKAGVRSKRAILIAFEMLNEVYRPHEKDLTQLLLLTRVELPMLQSRVQEVCVELLRKEKTKALEMPEIEYFPIGEQSVDYQYFMTEKQVRASSPEAADVLIVGKNAGAENLAVLQNNSGKIITENEWIKYLQKLNPPYLLLPENAEMCRTIQDFMSAADAVNEQLALGSMLTGGIPDALKTTVILSAIGEESEDSAMQVCRLHLTEKEAAAARYFWGFYLPDYARPYNLSLHTAEKLCKAAGFDYADFYAYYLGRKKARRLPT